MRVGILPPPPRGLCPFNYLNPTTGCVQFVRIIGQDSIQAAIQADLMALTKRKADLAEVEHDLWAHREHDRLQVVHLDGETDRQCPTVRLKTGQELMRGHRTSTLACTTLC
jgi:hypothetical protein